MIALFFDTETTGIPRDDFRPEIVQIAAILQDTTPGIVRPISEISLVICPDKPIPEEATNIHGISTHLATTCGVGSKNAEQIFGEMVMIADVIVAHNIEFDIQMVNLNWPAVAAMLDGKKYFDTMRELTPIMKLPKNGENHYHDEKFPDYKAPRLPEAYEYYFGRKPENAHDAMGDTRACRDIYLAMQKAGDAGN